MSPTRALMTCLLWGASVACGSDPAPEPAQAPERSTADDPRYVSRYVAREMRQVFPPAPVVEWSQPLAAGCVVDLGFADRKLAPVQTFLAEMRTASGDAVELLRREPHGRRRWHDARVRIPEPGGSVLVLRARRGLWSRPIVSCGESTDRRVNVVLVSLDTLRADRIRAYGGPRDLTPRLDAIAREGTVVERAYAHFPNTLGSHASLFTGLYPSQHRVRLAEDGAKLAPGQANLAQAFARSGYVTQAFTEDAYVGSHFGFHWGFHRYHDGPAGGFKQPGGPPAAQRTFDRAIDWLTSRPELPFFLFVHTYQAHMPYRPPQKRVDEMARRRGISRIALDDAAYRHENAEHLDINEQRVRPTPERIRQIELLYDAEVRVLDEHFGRLVDALRDEDLAHSTLLVVISDHGEEFYEHELMGHGKNLHEQTLRVPVIFHLPGRVPAGRRVDALIGLADVGPTLAELAGVADPLPGTPARSLAPLVLGTGDFDERPVFSELSARRDARGNGLQDYLGVAVRDRTHTFIHSEALGTETLYVWSDDPGEQRDVAATSPDVAARYRALVERYRRQVAHPTGSAAHAPVDLDDATEEKLRALGYIE